LCLGQMLEAAPPSSPPPAERSGTYTYDDHIKKFGIHHSAEEEPATRANFAKADAFIKKHNADTRRTSVMAHNHLSTLHESEKKAMRGAIRPKPATTKSRAIVAEVAEDRSYPASLDWRNNGGNFLAPIQNQGQCGSCWTFSASATLESRWAIVHGMAGNVPKLSEQNLVDCCHTGNSDASGCDGGWYSNAWAYTASKKGSSVGEMTMENQATLPKSIRGQNYLVDYPYTGEGGQSCKFSSADGVGAYATGYSIGEEMYYTNSLYYTTSASHTVTANSPSAIKAALQTGPISVAIDASNNTFSYYKSGTIQADDCGTTIDHAVNIIGYGSDDNGDYWLMRNSWGTDWGLDGYMKFARTDTEGSKGTCGVQQDGAYPNVGGSSSATSAPTAASATTADNSDTNWDSDSNWDSLSDW